MSEKKQCILSKVNTNLVQNLMVKTEVRKKAKQKYRRSKPIPTGMEKRPPEVEWTEQLISWTSTLSLSKSNLPPTTVHCGFYIGKVFNIIHRATDGKINYVDYKKGENMGFIVININEAINQSSIPSENVGFHLYQKFRGD